MRSFIAINLPDAVKQEIDSIADHLRPSGLLARWVPGSNLHLTLKFLDEISSDQVLPIRGAITMAIANVKPFDIRLKGFGVFPTERKARVFWVGIDEGYETLKVLAHAVDREISTLGFPREERDFSAHVTLARFREPGPADRLMKAVSRTPFESEVIRVESVELMKSVLSPKGAEYTKLESVRLTG